VVLPSATAIALGVIGIFSGFITSLLTLRRAPAPSAASPSPAGDSELADVSRW